MECFGDSSDDETEEGDNNEGTTTTTTTSVPTTIQRDESCGVCTFHPNTEASLLTHVRNTLKSQSSSPSSLLDDDDDDDDETNKQLQQSNQVLKAIDEFCMSRHWMMHVGPEKGTILLNSLRDAMKNKMMMEQQHGSSSSSSSLESNAIIPFVAVELGTYCGYASILMGRVFRQFQLDCMEEATKSKKGVVNAVNVVDAVNDNGGGAPVRMMDCHLITTEINPKCTEIASQMIQLCGLQNVISVRQISYNGATTDIVEVVRNSLPTYNNTNGNSAATTTTSTTSNNNNTPRKIDFLFIDHDKHSYKSDLIQLERSGLIRRGTKVVADNVLFAEITDYVEYVRRKEEGAVRTRTVRCHVEYSGCSGEEGVDGVEITDYLQDP